MQYALLAGLVLAAASGLNAFAPLLLFAMFAGLVHRYGLPEPLSFLGSPWLLAVLLVLLTAEIVVDKAPPLLERSRIALYVASALAGGLIFACCAMMNGTDPALLFFLAGAVIALGVREAKFRVRASARLGPNAVFNPLIGMAEDAFAILTSLVAILVPLASIPFLLVIVGYAAYGFRLKTGNGRLPGQTGKPVA